MIFLNSFKLLISNFSQFWKIVINKILVLLFSVLLLLPFIKIYMSVDYTLFMQEIYNLLTNLSFVNINGYVQALYDAVLQFVNIVTALYSVNAGCVIYTCIILGAVLPFLSNLSDIALGEVMYGSMSSLTKVSYLGSFIKKIGKSIIYSFFKALITVPVFCLSVYLSFLIIQASLTNQILLIFTPFILICLFAFIFALKNSITAGWLPAIIIFPNDIFTAFAKGLKIVSKQFFRTLSVLFCINFLICSIVCLFGPVSLIAIIPFVQFLNVNFQMIMAFTNQGMRYYVDHNTILTPKKLEETDKLSKAKNII